MSKNRLDGSCPSFTSIVHVIFVRTTTTAAQQVRPFLSIVGSQYEKRPLFVWSLTMFAVQHSTLSQAMYGEDE
jgi:hypothetical protein